MKQTRKELKKLGNNLIQINNDGSLIPLNPQDVVSVPSDCDCEKLRTCKYEVVGLYQGELPKPLYKAEFEADSYVDEDEASTVYDQYDDDYWDQFDDDDDIEEDWV